MIYLDNHATTPVDPRVLQAMLPYFTEKFGNAASRGHRFGWEAEKAVDLARRRLAHLANATAREIIFTSGATESNNLALKGAMEAARARGRHLVTMATEHKAVLDAVKHLERDGCHATVLPPRPDGLLDLDALRQALRPDTVLVSVMYANNEIGTVQPVAEIGALCHERGVLFHCDAVQAFGKIPVDVERDQIDLMSMSAHKLYGPKGVGALYVRKRNPRVLVAAQMDGGGHEGGMRSGTLNVPGIVGFGEACGLCSREMADEAIHEAQLRDRLKAGLMAGLEGVEINGTMERRLPGNLNVSIAGVDAETLLIALPDIALSTGSACTSATVEPSHVLKALGLSRDRAHSSVRFGLGRFNTEAEVDAALSKILAAVAKLRHMMAF
ncbi:MAG TPA: IscS subfamily cysteine desulfurase [Candidatus Sulfopaludibacter sp.]|jgi:cysteine desulfurase|nr:IscS subfamily cysteine desulfurase [Candidatus Sulfopaludibacter sp.]